MKSTNKVRAFSLLLAVCVLLSVFTAGVSAVSGTEGNARWEIKDGVLTVYGGDLPDHTASTAPAYALLSGKVRRIVVGEGVSYIGERSFEDMTAVTRVEIGEGVTSIGKMAFSGCSSLEGVTLPSSVTSIGDFAFAECLSLKTVSLSRGLAELGEGVFELTPSLRSITSDGERYVTKNGILCDTVKSSVYRFPSASIATSVTLEGWVTAVERGAFRDAAGLTGVNMPSVTDIGEGAFYGCSSLENIKMPMAKTIGMASFYGCGMQEMYLPASLESIGDSAFAFCQRLTTADFAGNAPAAEDGIFYGADPTFMILADPSCTGFGNEKWLSYPVMYHNIYGGEADGIVWTLNSRTGEFTATGNGGAIPDYESPADAPW